MIPPILSTVFMFVKEQKIMNDELKQRAINQYKAALLMPRKKKKQAKKSALLLHSIACWGDDLLNF